MKNVETAPLQMGLDLLLSVALSCREENHYFYQENQSKEKGYRLLLDI